jgi:hypothetical protein
MESEGRTWKRRSRAAGKCRDRGGACGHGAASRGGSVPNHTTVWTWMTHHPELIDQKYSLKVDKIWMTHHQKLIDLKIQFKS